MAKITAITGQNEETACGCNCNKSTRNASDNTDKLRAVLLKQRFMTAAVAEMWGNEGSEYSEEYIEGFRLVAEDIDADLEAMLEEILKGKCN